MPDEAQKGRALESRLSLSGAISWLKENPPVKVISVYLASSMAGLGQVDLVTARLGAPDWVFTVAVVVAVIGLFSVVLLAAAVKRGVTLGRFFRVIFGGMLAGWLLLALVDNLVDRETLPGIVYTTAVLVWLVGLPIGLSIALLWPSRRIDGDPPSSRLPEAL